MGSPGEYGAKILLLACCSQEVPGQDPLFHTGRYLPGLGGRKHSQGEFLAKVLAPMLLAALFVLAFSVYFFWGDQLIPTTVPQCISWILAPAGLGWLAFVATHFRAMGRRARGRILPLSVGILLMSSSTGMMAWFLVTYVMPPTTWAQYVTLLSRINLRPTLRWDKACQTVRCAPTH